MAKFLLKQEDFVSCISLASTRENAMHSYAYPSRSFSWAIAAHIIAGTSMVLIVLMFQLYFFYI